MFEGTLPVNSRYFEYLLEIGIIDQEHYNEVSQRCTGFQEKQLLFELSNIFANFTASDWFDLSCRIFKGWQKISAQFDENNASYHQSHFQTGESVKTEKQTQQTETYPNRRPEPISVEGKGRIVKNEPVSRPWERPQHHQAVHRDHNNYITPKKPFENHVIERLVRLNHILLNVTYESHYQNLKDCFEFLRAFAFSRASVSQGGDPHYPQRIDLIPKHNPRSYRKQGTPDYHNKLYYDHFQKQAQIEIKREIKKATELDGCTFYPQTNPLNSENENLVNTLRVPVYERLLQTKPVAANVILEKQEYRELKGATFNPDISKSQRTSKYRQNLPASPEDRKQHAVERLYGDAQIKEKIMFLKQLNRQEEELDGCSFFPAVLSPNKKKKQNQSLKKDQMSRSVDRLYDENLKRHRKLLKKEVEIRENELEGCTFHPERAAKKYRMKDDEGLEDLNAHERLYERFKRKKERNTHYAQDMNSSFNKENLQAQIRHRSHSISQDKITKSPKMHEDVNNISTPAFDRLYRDMEKRKVKIEQLRERVNKEEGATFKPKTNWSKHNNNRSISSMEQSQHDLKQASRFDSNKYSEEGYLGENVYSQNLSLRDGYTPTSTKRRAENEGRGYLPVQGNQRKKNF